MNREDCLEIIECLNHIHVVQQRSILTSHEHKKLIVECIKTIRGKVLSELAEEGRKQYESNQSKGVENEGRGAAGNQQDGDATPSSDNPHD